MEDNPKARLLKYIAEHQPVSVKQIKTDLGMSIGSIYHHLSGLGKLVQNTLHMLNTPYVEIMAVMANYNPFPEKAGMMRVPTESYINHDKGYLNALKKLQELGFDLDLLRSRNYCMSQLIKLTKQQQELVRKLVYDHFSIRWKKSSLRKRVYDGDLDAAAAALASHRLPYAYLIWKNPCQKFKKYPEPLLPVEVRA